MMRSLKSIASKDTSDEVGGVAARQRQIQHLARVERRRDRRGLCANELGVRLHGDRLLQPPSSSVARTVTPTPALTTTSLRMTVLKPCSETVTVYVPVMSDGTEKAPPSELTVANVSPVPMFLTATSTPGMMPPSASTTTPEMDPVDDPWASIEGARPNTTNSAATAVAHRGVIANSCENPA